MVTLLGMVTVARLLHSKKAPNPMLVMVLGMVTDVRPLQYAKAPPSMLVTLYVVPL